MSEITYAFPKRKNVDPSCYIDAYNLVLECSQAHSPRGFVICLLDLLQRVCPYDSAVAFFLDVNGRISGRYAIGLKDDWLDMYLDYYAEILKTDSPEFMNIYIGKRESSGFNFSELINWSTISDTAPEYNFKKEYIDLLGLKYSWGFCFFDLNGAYRAVISLDRIRNQPFCEIEQNRLGLALPILNNIYRNFFYQGVDTDGHMVQSPWKTYRLTPRESEIADLLCQGMTVQNISSVLYIAITTTYKHISHIFEKVGVSSQRELVSKLLSKPQ